MMILGSTTQSYYKCMNNVRILVVTSEIGNINLQAYIPHTAIHVGTLRIKLSSKCDRNI